MPETDASTSEVRSDPGEWIERHGDALFRFALVRLRNADLAEEVVQECFVAALAARDTFGGGSSERTWLVGILKRKIVDHHRDVARRDVVAADDEGGESVGMPFNTRGLWAESVAHWDARPADLLENGEFWAVFGRCLDGLPATLAHAFLLRELDEMSSEDVCQVLGISPTNLWARLHRARLGLRRCLEQHWFARPADSRQNRSR